MNLKIWLLRAFLEGFVIATIVLILFAALALLNVTLNPWSALVIGIVFSLIAMQVQDKLFDRMHFLMARQDDEASDE